MKTIITVWCLLTWLNLSVAQDQVIERKIGLSASLQKEQMDISMPVRSNSVVVAPSIKMLYAEDGGMDFGLGVAMKYYFRNTNVAPFMIGRVAAFGLDPEKGHSMMDYGFGFGAGADYFFDPNFSIGIEAQVNGTVSDKNSSRFGNPGGLNINTATMISASIYIF